MYIHTHKHKYTYKLTHTLSHTHTPKHTHTHTRTHTHTHTHTHRMSAHVLSVKHAVIKRMGHLSRARAQRERVLHIVQVENLRVCWKMCVWGKSAAHAAWLRRTALAWCVNVYVHLFMYIYAFYIKYIHTCMYIYVYLQMCICACGANLRCVWAD